MQNGRNAMRIALPVLFRAVLHETASNHVSVYQ